MTVIAFDGKTLAADKRAVNNGFKGGTVTKIHRWGDGHLCAFSGDYDVGLQLVAWLRAGARPDDFPKKQESMAANLLVVYANGTTARYESAPIAIPFENKLQAMGSGRDYALAAMYLGCDARRAVEVACALDNGCGNGIDELTL